MQATQYFDARLIEVSAADELVIEYQGGTLRLPGYPGIATRSNGAVDQFTAEKIGQIGVARFVAKTEHSPSFYRFEAYYDQTMRRAYELDVFERPDRPGIGLDGYNGESIGWRNDSNPDGFLAPRGIVPGKNGEFIEDTTTNVTIGVPEEFIQLCAEFKLQPENVLRGFIADACGLQSYMDCPRADGYSSNGSDERMKARDYIERAYAMWRDDA